MNYELKISNAVEENGKIDLIRLSHIAEGIRKVAEGALQIRLKGISSVKGRKKSFLRESLKVSLTGIKTGSTVLCLEAEKFKNSLEDIQLDMFRRESQIDLQEQTPISLFIFSFHEALSKGETSELLDKELLKNLKSFQNSFRGDNEMFSISNQNSIDTLELTKESFKKVTILEHDIPNPEPIVVNGIVEELKYSQLKVKIITEKGSIDGFLAEGLDARDIASFWGKEITLQGINHFKPNKSSIIEIQRIFKPVKEDSYFSKLKKAETVEEQLQRQYTRKSTGNLKDIVGKWPGNEDFGDLLKMLK